RDFFLRKSLKPPFASKPSTQFEIAHFNLRFRVLRCGCLFYKSLQGGRGIIPMTIPPSAPGMPAAPLRRRARPRRALRALSAALSVSNIGLQRGDTTRRSFAKRGWAYHQLGRRSDWCEKKVESATRSNCFAQRDSRTRRAAVCRLLRYRAVLQRARLPRARVALFGSRRCVPAPGPNTASRSREACECFHRASPQAAPLR